MSLDLLPKEIAAMFDERHLVYATAAWLLVQNLGRAWHAWKTSGGLIGIWNALVFGTNAPKIKDGNGGVGQPPPPAKPPKP